MISGAKIEEIARPGFVAFGSIVPNDSKWRQIEKRNAERLVSGPRGSDPEHALEMDSLKMG